MFVLQTIIVLEMILPVSCQCHKVFWKTFAQPNQPSCGRGNFYVRGLIIGSRVIDGMNMRHFEGAECCGAPPAWNSAGSVVTHVEWLRDVNEERLYVCPSGFFLNGFYTANDAEFPIQRLSRGNDIIARPRCVKPAAYPVYYQDCYEVKPVLKNHSSCREGYYVTGLRKTMGGASLLHLDAIICCSMAQEPYVIRNFEELKKRIMDVTFMRITELADALGFVPCKGANGMYCGEDMEYNQDDKLWETNNKAFDEDGRGKKRKGKNTIHNPLYCGEELIIVYDNWGVAVRNITYDNIVDDLIQPETIDSGTIYNMANATVKEFFEISQTSQEVITHTVKNTVNSGSQKTFSLNFEVFGVGVKPVSYSTVVDLSNTTTQNVDTLNSRTYRRHHEITLEPYTAATYNVSISKSKKTIQYTAFVAATFSVLMKSNLKWDAGFSGRSINYHNIYQGALGINCFNYSFGDQNVPFYKALKKQSESQSGPWLWNEIEDNIPGVREVIDRLTDERLYEFKIQGTLEKVSGTNIEVFWDTVSTGRNLKKG